MAKQTFTVGQVLTADQMTSLQQTAMGGGSTTAKTANYTLVAADAGTVVQMNSASSTTITVNTALFAAGDTIQIQNIGAGVCTVTAGTATVSTAGSLALSQYEGGQLYFNTTSAALFFDTVQASVASSAVGCLIYRSSNLTVSNSTDTFVGFDTESFDTDAFHSTATNTSRITIPAGKAGKYMIIAWAQFANNATGYRQMSIILNNNVGTPSRFGNMSILGSSTGGGSMSLSGIANLAVNDYLEMQVYQNSGGNLTLYGAANDIQFGVLYLGA